MTWQQIPRFEEYDRLCFQRGEFIAASKSMSPMTYRWDIFRILPDGSRELLGHVKINLKGPLKRDQEQFAMIDDVISRHKLTAE